MTSKFPFQMLYISILLNQQFLFQLKQTAVLKNFSMNLEFMKAKILLLLTQVEIGILRDGLLRIILFHLSPK